MYRHSEVHVGVLDGDGGLLREGIMEDEVLLLGLADSSSPATQTSAGGGGPVGGGGGGVGGDAQLPLPELLHVLDLLQGHPAMGGKEGDIKEKVWQSKREDRDRGRGYRRVSSSSERSSPSGSKLRLRKFFRCMVGRCWARDSGGV